MRRLAWVLLLAFAFAIPWEYSLDLGDPLGNIARLTGLAVLAATIPAALQARRMRAPGVLQGLTLTLFAWVCCTGLWTIDRTASLARMRGYFQELMIVWLVWELAESAEDLRWLLCAYVAGSWVLAGLTLANFNSPEAIAAGQMRFAAAGQDPNDVARFLNLGLPLAALLLGVEKRWLGRALAGGYLPLGVFAVLLTGSRSGFLVAVVAAAGCAALLLGRFPRAALGGALALPVAGAALWAAVPQGIMERLGTIPAQLAGGDLNQRWNLWFVGWQAFVREPLLGTGAGTFVEAAGTAALDTAHNSALSMMVDGGLVELGVAAAIVTAAFWLALRMRGALRVAMLTALLVWLMTCLTATVEGSRTTWLLMGVVALAARLQEENPEALAAVFDVEERTEKTPGVAWERPARG